MALTAAGLTNAGRTTHYQFKYDDSLTGSPEPGRTNAVIAACEGDFNLMSGWFGNIKLDVNLPISVNVVPPGLPGSCAKPGGCATFSDGNLIVTVSDLNVVNNNISIVRYLMITEVVENFMRVQNKGWFGNNTEGSQGEGLSRFLGAQFLSLFGLGNPLAGYLNSNTWLSTPQQGSTQLREDWVNRIDTGDDGPDSKTGCSLLFIWYLFNQLGFNIDDIVAAAAFPLSAVYKKLMGDPNDPFPPFLALMNNILPGSSQITNGTDNTFPATFDGMLLQVRFAGPIWVIFGNGRFQIPDDATRVRLFPGASIFPCGDFVFGINTIPDDGTMLREESSTQVWLIQNRTRVLAPPDAPGTVHVLWDGALAQIPLPAGTLVGVVTDSTAGVPLNDATVIITSSGIIPATGSNTEQLSTDAQGRYNSSFLPPGVYSVKAVIDGFVPSTLSATILAGVPTTILDFPLERTVPFTITGQITDTTGAPVVATVQLTENAPVPGVITAKTDAAGNYSITMDPGPFDGSYTIRVTAPGFTSNGTTLQKIANGAMLTLNFTLEQQGVLTGHVRDQRGPAIGGAKIKVGTVETFTGVDGAYSVAVDPGQFAVTASAPEFNTVTETAQVPIGQSVTLDFLLAATIPGSVAGRVTDDGGTPLVHARVAALNTNFTTTDANGQYTLTNLQPVPTQMVASLGVRFIPDQEIVNIVSGQTVTQDFVLVAKGGTIRVKAQAAAKGAVAAG